MVAAYRGERVDYPSSTSLTWRRTAPAARTAGPPGPEASIGKLVAAELNQEIYEFCMDLLGVEGTLYGSYDDLLEVSINARGHAPSGGIQQRFLRSRANTVEGGTSEILRNVLGERVLGLPGDMRADVGLPWREIPRG
jgi:alkylation response protein AidB-like acyl-CoA dehydrogenase